MQENLLRESITPHSIANAIRMKRTQFSGSFLIVEGDIDARVYKNFIEEKSCQIENAYNKAQAIEVLEIINKDNFAGALAIVDADFDILEQKRIKTKNLFLTDFHDLECLILASPALEKVLAEFGSEGKIKNFEQASKKTVREAILERGAIIGHLRRISLLEQLSLKFEELDFSKFVEKDSLNFDLPKCINRIKINSKNSSLNEQQTIGRLNQVIVKNKDLLHISCGKDLIEILTIGLRKVLGTNDTKVNSEIVSRDLRLAYEFTFFSKTDLYKNVKKWEKTNIPYKVFI